MEYESPIRHGANKYTIPIVTTKYLDVIYETNVVGSATTPPLDRIECRAYIADMASLYEAYTKKWFNREVLSIIFATNVQHNWKHPAQSSYVAPKYRDIPVEIHQIWCPEHISLDTTTYTIHWVLRSGEQNEIVDKVIPSDSSSVEVPYGSNQILMVLHKTTKSEYQRKVRNARIQYELARERLYKLILRYTERYGDVGGDQGGSDTDSSFGPD
jgi:hypothetical protein